MCDIDHFKVINDTHGHQAGDEVLVGFVCLLRGALRSFDLLGRLGGEEFVVITPGIRENDPSILYERIRNRIADNAIATRAGTVSITVSIGIAAWTGIENEDELLAAADSAMYRAKRDGRNRVRLAERRIVDG
jgi:diguanylate cyclase (GGDEF)-like protein